MAERRFYMPARLQWWGVTLLIMPWLHAATSVPAQAGSAILERTSGIELSVMGIPRAWHPRRPCL